MDDVWDFRDHKFGHMWFFRHASRGFLTNYFINFGTNLHLFQNYATHIVLICLERAFQAESSAANHFFLSKLIAEL